MGCIKHIIMGVCTHIYLKNYCLLRFGYQVMYLKSDYLLIRHNGCVLSCKGIITIAASKRKDVYPFFQFKDEHQ